MRRLTLLAAVCVGALGVAAVSRPAEAQVLIGFQPGVGPICNGPLGVAPCVDIQNWMARQAAMASAPQLGVPVPGFQNGGGLPGAGLLPQDGIIVAEIAQDCGGQPVCMASAWGSVEVERCRNGFGTPGGCFGPNGEIMRVINRFVPQNFQPNVIISNVASDVQNGAGANNDVVGCNGWLSHRLGGHC